jgi:hypothetical protein
MEGPEKQGVFSVIDKAADSLVRSFDSQRDAREMAEG